MFILSDISIPEEISLKDLLKSKLGRRVISHSINFDHPWDGIDMPKVYNHKS